MSDLEKVVDRVHKLIRLASSNPSSEEATAAAVAAVKLIASREVKIGIGPAHVPATSRYKDVMFDAVRQIYFFHRGSDLDMWIQRRLNNAIREREYDLQRLGKINATLQDECQRLMQALAEERQKAWWKRW